MNAKTKYLTGDDQLCTNIENSYADISAEKTYVHGSLFLNEQILEFS